jgi:hypothetical protein
MEYTTDIDPYVISRPTVAAEVEIQHPHHTMLEGRSRRIGYRGVNKAESGIIPGAMTMGG